MGLIEAATAACLPIFEKVRLQLSDKYPQKNSGSISVLPRALAGARLREWLPKRNSRRSRLSQVKVLAERRSR